MTPLCQWDFPGDGGMIPIIQPPSDGGGGGTWLQNLPNGGTGWTLVSDQPMSSLPSNGWSQFGGASHISDATAPKSPNTVVDYHFDASFAGGNSPASADLSPTNFAELYFCTAVKYSANWRGHPSFVNKQIHLWIDGGNKCVITAYGDEQNPMYPVITFQDIISGGNTGGGTSGLYEDAHVPYIRGQWHQLECHAEKSTGTNANGRVRIWFDGNLAATAQNINIRNGVNWDMIQISAIWGGTGQVTGQAQDFYIDHITVYGK